MGMRELERAILAEARVVFDNPRLRLKDIMEWRTGEIESHEGEVVAHLTDLSVYVSIKKEHDKR